MKYLNMHKNTDPRGKGNARCPRKRWIDQWSQLTILATARSEDEDIQYSTVNTILIMWQDHLVFRLPVHISFFQFSLFVTFIKLHVSIYTCPSDQSFPFSTHPPCYVILPVLFYILHTLGPVDNETSCREEAKTEPLPPPTSELGVLTIELVTEILTVTLVWVVTDTTSV
jgi:hypothetical protein